MARYIDLDAVEFLKVDGNEEFNRGVDCCINRLLKIEPVDVIERTEYEKLRKEYEHYKRLVEQDNKLRSKVDKAVEELIKEIEENHLNVIDYADGEWIVKDFVYGTIERFKKSIGE
jgi:nicotinamide mononucleotide adenylyltransferase